LPEYIEVLHLSISSKYQAQHVFMSYQQCFSLQRINLYICPIMAVMSDFIVSARKFRPENFDMVVGQGSITSTLKNAIRTGHLAHAYLFCGPRGVGKTTCARIFAKTINCKNPSETSEACNECESCKSFKQNRSFNIHELDAASNNSVEDIRLLIEKVRIPPQISRYSVYIIDEVHMLSQSAFNAFLKTLEEPPKHAIFILATTEKHKILPTILSRCQIFDFNRILIKDIVAYLSEIAAKEQIEFEPDALNIIAQKADGAMRDALSLFDQIVSFSEGKITYHKVIENLNVLDYEYYFRLTEYFLSGNVEDTLLLFDEVLAEGFDPHNFINGLSSHFRDLLVCKVEKTALLLEVGDSIKKRYQEQSALCTDEFLFTSLEICNSCDLSYRSSRNQRLHVELTLIKLCNQSQKKK
jgi:DNA polymerase III subunit gamma/tau